MGYERMQEMTDPTCSLDRARETWLKHGRSEKWVQQRMTGQETRNKPVMSLWAGRLLERARHQGGGVIRDPRIKNIRKLAQRCDLLASGLVHPLPMPHKIRCIA